MAQVKLIAIAFILLMVQAGISQEIIPLDTVNWKVGSQASYVVENFRGKNAIYLKGGQMGYKGDPFINGTIEFDVFLKKEQGFPGVQFRIVENDAEMIYLRPRLPGQPDANQVAPVTNGITPWQLYFGPKYSFPYDYKYNDWTHIKILVSDNRAQIFLDYSEEPHLSWNLFHPTREGGISFRAGGGRRCISQT